MPIATKVRNHTLLQERKKFMEGTGKHAVTVMVVMMMMTLLMMSGAKANIEKEGGCLERCLEGCKHSGISPLRCFKYCEKRCGSSPSPSFAAGGHKQQQPPPPPGHHFCNLGCMLEKCSKFHDDEAKEEACALDCKNHVCKPANSQVPS